jgi:serine/threonine protein kinase
LVLFLEHFPHSLGDWLRSRADDVEHLEAVLECEAALLGAIAFMHQQKVLHFDVHAANVVTDGTDVVLGDFGLATSRGFDLDAEEQVFLDQHGNFDQCMAITSCIHAVGSRHHAGANWRESLREIVEHGCPQLPDGIRSYLVRRSPVAMALGDHYRRLTAGIRTIYPTRTIQELLSDVI